VKRHSYLFVAFAVGKWTQETCSQMMGDFKRSLRRPMRSEKIEIFTDGNDDYTYALPCFFKARELNYGQLVKIRDANGRLIRKEIRVVYGNSDVDEVETVNVENFNSILRERVGRLVRKTKCFSKKKLRLVCAIDLFMFYWNFMSELKRGLTPAIMEDCATCIWSWHDFYYSAITHLN
jgi:hypothetical protein